jgi:hypothetical protein
MVMDGSSPPPLGKVGALSPSGSLGLGTGLHLD